MATAKCRTAINLAALIEAAHYQDEPRRMLVLLDEVAELAFCKVELMETCGFNLVLTSRRCCESQASAHSCRKSIGKRIMNESVRG